MHKVAGVDVSLVVLQATLVVTLLILNTMMNMYNKWLFMSEERKGAGLIAPLFVTMTHATAAFTMAFTLSQFPKIYTKKKIEGFSGWAKVLAVSACFSAGVGFNNSSLLHIPLSLAQMIKSLHPAVLAICLFLIEGTRFSVQRILAILGIVVGVSLSVVGNVDARPIGVIFSFSSVLAGALHVTFLSVSMGPSVRFDGLDVLYYTTPPVVVLMFLPFVLTGEPEVISQFIELNGLGKFLLLVIFGCILAVAFNFVQLTFIKALSAIYLSVTGTAKVALVVFLSVVLFGEHVGPLNLLGIVIALGAFGVNSHLTYLEKKTNAAKPKTPKGEEDAPKKDVEKGVSEEKVPLIGAKSPLEDVPEETSPTGDYTPTVDAVPIDDDPVPQDNTHSVPDDQDDSHPPDNNQSQVDDADDNPPSDVEPEPVASQQPAQPDDYESPKTSDRDQQGN